MSLRTKLAVAAAVLTVVGVVAGAAGGGGRPGGGSSPGLSALLHDPAPGRIVVDTRGRPVEGPDGRPLRVAGDGRTLLDSEGNVLRDAQGRPLRLGEHNRLPARALRPGESGARPDRAPGSGAPPRPDQAASAAPGGEPVTVGAFYLDPGVANSAYGQLGMAGTVPDTPQLVRAMRDHIDATGGVGGRHVELRLRKYGDNPSLTVDQMGTELCAHFTSGNRPLAVFGPYDPSFVLAECLREAGIPLFVHHPADADTGFYARHPFSWLGPSSMAIDRFPRPYVRTLVEGGLLGRGDRVGLLRIPAGYPNLDRAAELVRKALADARIPLAAEKAIGKPERLSDLGRFTAEMSGAAVEFRAKGVNRVLSVDTGGLGMIMFMRAAESQGYRPRYGLSSTNAPLWAQANVAPAQLRGSQGIGWSPMEDVPARSEGPPNATRALCDGIFKRAGVYAGGRDDDTGMIATSICDQFLSLQAAVARSGELSTAGIQRGYEALGASLQLSMPIRTHIDAGHHDGAEAYRRLRFDSSCRCFEYVGAPESAR